jgi:fermentation-respiration switch protein FrsA (DUF1100 family)
MNMPLSRWKAFLVGPLSIKRIMISILEIYVALLIFAWFFADRIIHHPPAHQYPPLEGEISISASDGIRISAVWLPNPHATHTILYSHGNGEDLYCDLPFLREYRDAGFNVLGYDYRGYGHSEGKPSEAGLYRDIEAAYAHLIGPLKIAPGQIIVMGHSLGGGPSAHLAATRPVGGLILESTFTSAFLAGIPFKLFPFDQFPSRKRLEQIRCPLFVIHGTLDNVISIRHGRKLFAAYTGPKRYWWVEGAGHNDLFEIAQAEYLKKLQEFARSLPTKKPGD